MNLNLMKQLLLITFLFCCNFLHAQVQKLGELSSGTLVSSSIIYDDETNDVYGYFLLYRNDRMSRETYQAEYVILDKNLNKVNSNTFNQSSYKFFMASVKFELNYVKKMGDKLFIALIDKIYQGPEQYATFNNYVNPRFRVLDLNTYELSDEKVLINNTFKDRIFKENEVTYIEDFIDNQYILKTNGNYLLSFATPEHNPKMTLGLPSDKKNNSIKSFSVFDENLNLKWTQKINQTKDEFYEYNLIFSGQKHFILLKKHVKSLKKNYDLYSYEEGFIKAINLDDIDFGSEIEDVIFENDKILLFTKNYKKNKKHHDYSQLLSFSKITLDFKGNQINKQTATWTDLTRDITFENPSGKIKNYGKLEVVDFVSLEDDTTIFVLEGYKSGKHTELLDLFIAKMDKDFQLEYFNKIEKNKTEFKNINADGSYLKRRGAFDYIYHQKLDDEGNLVFFYVNNIKEGSKIQKRKNPEWILGIITYVDGEFNYDKLQLTNKDSKIIPGKAKNGYIRLLEYDDEDVEIRLEKINY